MIYNRRPLETGGTRVTANLRYARTSRAGGKKVSRGEKRPDDVRSRRRRAKDTYPSIEGRPSGYCPSVMPRAKAGPCPGPHLTSPRCWASPAGPARAHSFRHCALHCSGKNAALVRSPSNEISPRRDATRAQCRGRLPVALPWVGGGRGGRETESPD
jgi:hypothetical protein